MATDATVPAAVQACICPAAPINHFEWANKSFSNARREEEPVSVLFTLFTAKLAATNADSAAEVSSRIDQANLYTQLIAKGLLQGTLILISKPESNALPSGQSL